MGAFRLTLAAIVLLFHLGGLNWVTGRVAVGAFLMLSGFVIARALDRQYVGHRGGVLRFYANRVLRILPLLVALSGLQYALLRRLGSALPLDAGTGDVTLVPLPDLTVGTALLATLRPRFGVEHGVPVLSFDGGLVPQAWSIGIELVFYLLAPLVLFAYRRVWPGVLLTVGALVLTIVATLTEPTIAFFHESVYRNTFTNFWLFALGVGLHVAGRGRGRPALPGYFSLLALLLVVGLVVWPVPSLDALGDGRFLVPLAVAYAVALSAAALVALAAPPTGGRAVWDLQAGRLSYGVYLNHMLVAYVLIAANAAWGAQRSWAPNMPFGRVNTLRFGVLACVLSVVFAACTFALVERPLERLRHRLRPASPEGTDSPVHVAHPR